MRRLSSYLTPPFRTSPRLQATPGSECDGRCCSHRPAEGSGRGRRSRNCASGVLEGKRIPGRVHDRVRQAAVALALLALAASALYGGDFFGVRQRLLGTAPPPPKAPAVSRVAEEATATVPEKTRVRSQPWWQSVDTFQGVGSMTTPVFTIDEGALQWRAKWSCQSGQLVLDAPAHPQPLVDATCPGTEAGYSVHTGRMSLNIRADGAWQLQIEQQVDVPLNEPPLPAMTAGAVEVATGRFHNIDQSGRGRVTIYRLADDTYAVRLDDFFVTPNVDLELRLSPLQAPQSTDDYLSAPSALVAFLDVTAGSMNFAVPPTIDPTQYRSVVIWCPPLDSAYAAASLTPHPP